VVRVLVHRSPCHNGGVLRWVAQTVLRRARDAQRCLLGGDEAAQVHHLATALHLRLVGLGPTGMVVHAEVATCCPRHELLVRHTVAAALVREADER